MKLSFAPEGAGNRYEKWIRTSHRMPFWIHNCQFGEQCAKITREMTRRSSTYTDICVLHGKGQKVAPEEFGQDTMQKNQGMKL